MNKYFRKSASGEFAVTCLLFLFLLLPAQPAGAALNSARITQVIRDVKLVPSSATPRPATINDDVREGTAVRTGQDSRTELTFTDKTLTRLGANSIFSFNVGAGTFDLGQGAILMQVPPNGSSVKVKTAAVTAAITGGTAIFGTGPPTKFMVLEGTGTFYPAGHPEEAVTLHSGEMVTLTPDGHLVGPVAFDVKKVLETSELIINFPDLANLPLILAVIQEQEALYAANPLPPPPKDTTEVVDQEIAASPTPTPTPESTPTPTPSGTPGKYGTPIVISSPVPYVITSGTTITTDPTITTNSVTDFGKVYRDEADDGTVPDYLYGSSRPFDAMVFDEGGNEDGDYAVFKFQNLQLAGAPIISTADGGAMNLALVSVGPITSAGPGGTLTFAGMQRVFIATQNGSITLGPEIAFADLPHLEFYARGVGSNLTLGSIISNVSNLKLYAEGTIQINGDITVTDEFKSISGGDFLVGTGTVTAFDLEIISLSNITIDASKFPDPADGGGTINLNAADTLSIINMGGVFNRDSLTAQAMTINLQSPSTPTTFDFSQSSNVSFTAGTGGINASGIDFFGHNLTLESGGDIDIYSARIPSGEEENQILDGTINAAGNITSVGDVNTGTIHAGGSMMVGGQLLAGDISADVDISGVLGITAVGGSIVAGGNITSQNGTIELGQNPPGTFGNITAGGNIFAGGGIFTPGDPVVVMAGGSITAPGVITGTLQAGTDITIDNTGGDFSFGIVANHIMAGGTLFMMNSSTISPNNGGFGGHDGETLDDFTMTVGSIVSTGPTYPVLSSNGGDANSDFDDSNPGNGGNITINITLAGLSVGDAQNLDSIAANGGAFNAGGPYNGGNGGRIDITATGDVSISDGASAAGISATTGIVSDVLSEFGGEGGTVNITSSGRITVDGTVQVSSDDASQFTARPEGDEFSGRESASGGTIYLQSNLTTGAGITIGSDGQLLSLLGFDAPGDSGSITLSTMGADIVVNGTVRADFGTVTLDQDDPPGATPTITLDGGTVQTATFNINGSGDLTIGPNNSTAINIFGGTWNVAHDITINAANTSFAYSFALNAMAGNAINFTGGNSDFPATLAFPLSGDTTFTAGAGGINAQFVDIQYAGAALNLVSAGDITAHSIAFTDFYARGSVNAAGAITITNDLSEGIITAGTSIDVGGNFYASTISAGTTVTAGGYIEASSVTAGGDISANAIYVQTITSPTGVLTSTNTIQPYVFSTDPAFPAQGAKAPHVFTVDSIVAPNGIDFSGNQFDGIDGYSSGGILTINANSLSFDSSTGIGPVNFNGADENGFSNGTTPTLPGDGGNLTVNTTGTIVVNSDIEATSGHFQPVPYATPAGFGGTVELNSTDDSVTVNNRIEVSSAEPASTIAPFRQSASGGNIKLTSGKTSGVAINVTSSAQLLSLLSAAAPGPGGKITILASASNNSGNSSSINIDNSNGLIAADGSGGTVDIEHNGDSGTININNANIRADVVKVGAFGDNGTLNIGGGVINADTMLKLYATGSNGSVNFIADATLSGASTKIIAGNSVTIFNSVVVTIGGPAATVYTNHPNYTGSGGNNSTTGIFSGSGATTVPSGTPPPAF